MGLHDIKQVYLETKNRKPYKLSPLIYQNRQLSELMIPQKKKCYN